MSAYILNPEHLGIRGAAIRNLPGFDQAQWEFTQPTPEIEALYQRGAS